MMNCYVAIATKGRPELVAHLVERLRRQSTPPRAVVVVGTCPGDLPRASGALEFVTDRIGLTAQRNVALERIFELIGTSSPRESTEDAFVAFFDDDFVPHAQWLEQCARLLEANSGVVGLSGRLLADGARGEGIAELEADALISGALPHHGHAERHCLYGCNMAIRLAPFASERFDETLPLYSWLEDRDISARLRPLGTLVETDACIGVHLGHPSGGRKSGVRFGYSQIANPLYLWRKRTMSAGSAAFFLARALGSNSLRSMAFGERASSYRGRFIGNLRAAGDLLRGRMSPRRIVDF